MPLLVLVRHGQSSWNLENRFTGEVDVDLTPLGQEEARAAGQRLKDLSFTRSFTSMLRRAFETLTLILEVSGQPDLPIIRDKALNERNYGQLQGLNKAETAQKYGDRQVAIWRRSYTVRPPGGESLQDTAARVIPYYKKEIEPLLQNGENILVVAHGNSLRALMMHLEKISEEQIAEVNIPTGTPRVYKLKKNLEIEKAAYL
ncbi:MAG TPA: 2,3-diphosphoglycerate-dependent phosphoglycerate mutase [Puia sp.]|jgi:2,3-bisphosphoglycerate-dependent phosphoglycerate mutase|nr:2,3-diphosphoglycerate-dependent phosphoglycerate mutase [Puia sp.]